MPLRPIYYDTETTGIKADKEHIIEIAAYDPVLNRTYQSFVNPGRPIPPEATAIHHITDEMVVDAPSFGAVALEFIEFCQGETVLIAHNNDQFDVHFLKQEFQRHELPFPQWKFLDSLKWARKYRPDLPRHTLQFLREMYGIAANQAHRALDDVMVLHNVFSQMIDDLPMEVVYSLVYQPRQLQTMPFGKYQGQPLQNVPSSYVKWLASSGALDKGENQDLKERFEKLGILPSVETQIAPLNLA